MIASFNGLLRGLYFPTASPHPATLSGFFRLGNAFLLVVGWIILEREWRKQRKDSH
jgi:hypothetical protein